MFLLVSSTRRLRPLVLGAIGLVSAAILLSLSRGALVGLAAGFLLFVLTDRRRLQVTMTAGIVAIVATVLVIIATRNASTMRCCSSRTSRRRTSLRATGRGAPLPGSRLEHPLLGVGPGNYGLYYNRLTGQPVGGLTLDRRA